MHFGGKTFRDFLSLSSLCFNGYRKIFFHVHLHQYLLMFIRVTGGFSFMLTYINILSCLPSYILWCLPGFSFMFTYINILMFTQVTDWFSFMFTYINILWCLPELQVDFLLSSLTSIAFDVYPSYRWAFFHVHLLLCKTIEDI